MSHPVVSMEQLAVGLAASEATSVVESAAKRLAYAIRRLAEVKAEPMPSSHTVSIWEIRVEDMKAALETYNHRLRAAKIAAGWVN